MRVGLGRDIRSLGSGNAGATNVGRVLGRRAALAVFALDALKGAAAVLVAGALDPRPWTVWSAGTLSVAGHIWPAFHRFRGGKGAATAAGALAALSPWTLACALAVFAIVTAWRRIVAYGSTAAVVAALPAHASLAAAGLVAGGAARLVPLAAMSAAIVWAHRGNLREGR